MRRAPRHQYFNPKDCYNKPELDDPDVYVPKDIGQICHSDLVICYAEANNPGAGYLFEMGYCAGVGIPYVFINEQKLFPERYMSMYIWAANAYYTAFDWTPQFEGDTNDGCSFLEDVRTDGMEVYV
jgi:nucleoside 2-deoxyribosyltransferase